MEIIKREKTRRTVAERRGEQGGGEGGGKKGALSTKGQRRTEDCEGCVCGGVVLFSFFFFCGFLKKKKNES